MSESEMDAALDALEEEHGVVTPQDQEPEEFSVDEPGAVVSDLETDEESEPEADPEPEQKSKPPGFLSYQEWIDKGKDPADYKGENAYNSEYERIKETRELKGTLSRVVDGFDEWKQTQQAEMQGKIEQAKLDAVAELEEARADLDVSGALEAQEKLNKLNQEKPKVESPAEQKINPVIQEFYDKNPMVNPDSPHFDKDFYTDMATAQKAVLLELTGGNQELIEGLTQEQVQRSMSVAHSRARAFHADKFVSKRNSRQSAPQSSRNPKPAKVDWGAKLKATNISNAHNPGDTSYKDMYDDLKAADPAVAEKYARSILGE